MFVFGMDIPLPEILAILIFVLLVALVFIVYQIYHINRHMKILEDTTLQIRSYEEQEIEQVRRFETDVRKLEADEAELFVTKIVPTVSKLENYVAVELLKGSEPEAIKGAIIKRGISSELATKVVNSMTYYLDFFQKLPNRKVDSHVQAVSDMKVSMPKGK
jgi:hypothetical protein